MGVLHQVPCGRPLPTFQVLIQVAPAEAFPGPCSRSHTHAPTYSHSLIHHPAPPPPQPPPALLGLAPARCLPSGYSAISADTGLSVMLPAGSLVLKQPLVSGTKQMLPQCLLKEPVKRSLARAQKCTAKVWLPHLVQGASVFVILIIII